MASHVTNSRRGQNYSLVPKQGASPASIETIPCAATDDRYLEITLVGLTFTDFGTNCEVDLAELIETMFPTGANQVFVRRDESYPEKPASSEDRVAVTGWVFGIESDRTTPFLINARLAEKGIAQVDESASGDPMMNELISAQNRAKESGAGVWGDCNMPILAPDPTQTPLGQILDWKGNGDQVSTLFTILSDGTYRLTANGSASLLFVDLYDQYGNWIPGFSISASGEVSSLPEVSSQRVSIMFKFKRVEPGRSRWSHLYETKRQNRRRSRKRDLIRK